MGCSCRLCRRPARAIYRRFPSLNGAVDASELMGKALLSVDWISDIPGIFRPGSEAPRHGHTVAPDFHQDRFCEALSLAENKHVCWEYSWGRLRRAAEFNAVGAGDTVER